MFDTGFAMLFRAVSRIRTQLERADPEFRTVLAEELGCLRQLGDQYIDHWLSLDEQIDDLFKMYQLPNVAAVGGTTPWQVSPATFASAQSVPVAALDGRLESSWHGLSTFPKLPATVIESSNESEEGEQPLDDEWHSLAFDVPDPAMNAFRQGLGYYDLLMFEDASKSLQRVLDHAEHPVARLYLAAAHAARQRFDQAMEQVMQVRSLTQHPVVLCATYEVEAQIRLAQEDVESAVKCLKTIVRMVPDYRDVWYNLGICLAYQGDYAGAANALYSVIQRTPKDIMAWTALIRVELLRDRVDDAAHVCQAALEHYPSHVHLLYAWSHVLDRQGKSSDALRLIRQIANQNPTFEWASSRLAWLLLRSRRWDDAIAALKKHLTLCPDHHRTLLQLGVTHLLAGEVDRAEGALMRSLVEYPDKSIIWIALGRISAMRGELGKAYARFLRAMRDHRQAVRRLALYYYGISLSDQGQWDESEKYLKAAAHLGVPNRAILLALARVADRQGRCLEADRLRARARHVNPV